MYFRIMLLFTIFISLSILIFNAKGEKKGPKVFLTVSSLAKGTPFQPIQQRNIIFNYYDADCKRMFWTYPFIGLYSHDPKLNVNDYIFLKKPENCPQGRINTNISLPFYEFTNHNLKSPECLGYWAAYFEAGVLVHSSCISTHPQWMYEMKDLIGERSLKCLVIPSTHNSGCYAHFDPNKNTVYEKYTLTQEENIFNQLVFGIRQLDLRIWYKKGLLGDSKIKITHDQHHLGLPDLKDVLLQVRDFVVSTNEIVIVDFHRKLTGVLMLSDLQRKQNREVIDLIKSVFGSLLIDRKFETAPLKLLWEMNKRVLITYSPFGEEPIDKYVTYNVHHWWGDVDKTSDLYDYLKNKACTNTHLLTASVAVLTPNKWMPVTDINFSNRDSAEEVNSVLNAWFRNTLSCSNIVMTDYFLGNNIIEISIEQNKKKNRCA